jgi:hypothetical protein
MIVHIGKSGLCCRLSILLRVMEIHKNNKIQIIWIINSATVDEIGKYIMPIDNVEFLPINSDIIETLPINSDIVKFLPINSDIDITNIEYKYYDHRITRKEIDDEILLNQLSKIKLSQELQNIVNNFVKTYFPYISIHVRRTDFVRYCSTLRNNGHKNTDLDIEPFYNFIEKNDNYKVFLTTDCAKTRTLFKEKYGDKIITYHNSFSTGSLRQIDMNNTMLDLFIAGQGIDFLGTNYSSFSKIINKLIILNKGKVV